MKAWASALSAALLFAGGDAAAQCGAKRSTCSACHDGLAAPVPSARAWHADHAFADLCSSCHGGDPEAATEFVAHADRAAPLEEARCSPCHAGKAGLLSAYRAARARPAEPAAVVAPRAEHGDPWPNAVVAGIVVVLGVFGGGLVARLELDRRRSLK